MLTLEDNSNNSRTLISSVSVMKMTSTNSLALSITILSLYYQNRDKSFTRVTNELVHLYTYCFAILIEILKIIQFNTNF